MKHLVLLSKISHQKNVSKTLIFIHGFLCSAKIWSEFIERFKNDYIIYLVNLPGHTGGGDTIESISELSNKIAAQIQENNIKNTTIIGHSLGGYIAGELVNHKELKIESIILINSSLIEDSAEKKLERDKAIRAVTITPTIFSKSIIENLFLEQNRTKHQNSINIIQENAKSIQKETIVSYLNAIKTRKNTLLNTKNTPILYISSLQDSTIPFKNVKNQIKNKNQQLVTLKNSNHMSFIEESKTVAEAIHSFFISLDY